MPHDITRQASALIEHIQTRFHDGHRRVLPELLAMAAAVEARCHVNGIADGLVEPLRAIGNAPEQHMFKEEMRLFPMMEQGGNSLIGQLIEDLHREHVEHEDAMHSLRARLEALHRACNADPAILQLIHAVNDLANELAQHIRVEDEELFPMFLRPGPLVRPASLNP